MSPFKRNRHRTERDLTGWVLGAAILVLATVDLFVWATLWNVPNPVSKLLTTERAHASSTQTSAAPADFFH